MNVEIRMEKIFDYRLIIVKHLSERQCRNPNYSMRAFARDIGMTPSKLSECLRGKKGISYQKALTISTRLSLTGTDLQLFLLSVAEQHSRSPNSKRIAAKRKREILDSNS